MGGDGVDEAREEPRLGPRDREVAALPPVEPVAGRRHVDPGEGGHRVRVEPGRVHDALARERLDTVGSADLEPVVAVAPLDRHELGARLQDGAVAPRLVEERVHEAVRAHDARRRREEAGHRGNRRLEAAALVRRQHRELGPVGAAEGEEPLELGRLGGRRGHDELRDPAVGDALPLAQLVEQVLPPDAQPGLPRAGRVVHAGVDDLAVAARGLRPVALPALQHDGLREAPREPRGHREPDDARPHDRQRRVSHGADSTRRCRRRGGRRGERLIYGARRSCGVKLAAAGRGVP